MSAHQIVLDIMKSNCDNQLKIDLLKGLLGDYLSNNSKNDELAHWVREIIGAVITEYVLLTTGELLELQLEMGGKKFREPYCTSNGVLLCIADMEVFVDRNKSEYHLSDMRRCIDDDWFQLLEIDEQIEKMIMICTQPSHAQAIINGTFNPFTLN
jgi:hypothetical protein